MSQDEKTVSNNQNAQLSTGPKTEEGKAKIAENALSIGQLPSKQPLLNADFQRILQALMAEFAPQDYTQRLLILELAHVGWKLEQIPSIEFEVELTSGLTLAQHFAQEKPTPLTRLWNLELRLQGRLFSIRNKILAAQNKPNVCHCSVSSDQTAPAPKKPLQNKPTLGAPSACSGSRISPSNTQKSLMQNKPTPSASPLQNKPNSALAKAVHTAYNNILQSLNPI